MIIWPQERYAEVLLQAGISAVMPYLQDQIEACSAASALPTARAQAIALATRVLDAWENQPGHQTYGQSNAATCRVKMLDALGLLGEAALLQRFVGGLLTRDYDGTENVALAAHARILTPQVAGKLYIAVTNIVARPTVFDPGKTIVPALTKLHPRQAQDPADDHAFLRLWMHAGAFLLERSERSPNVPMNWRQDVKPACNCEDCRALNVFAHDAKEQVGRFRVRQDRRQHLQDVIDRRDLDMTYMTDPKGSPQTLVCTKTRRTYQRQCKQYRADLHSFNKLLEALPRSPDACATLASKIAQARERGKGWSASKT